MRLLRSPPPGLVHGDSVHHLLMVILFTIDRRVRGWHCCEGLCRRLSIQLSAHWSDLRVGCPPAEAGALQCYFLVHSVPVLTLVAFEFSMVLPSVPVCGCVCVGGGGLFV